MEQVHISLITPSAMPEFERNFNGWSDLHEQAATTLGDYLEARPFPPVALKGKDGLNRTFLIGCALLQCARDLDTGKPFARLETYIQQHTDSRNGTRIRIYMAPVMNDAADKICAALLKLPNPPFYATWKGKHNHTFAITISLFYAVDLIPTLPQP